MANTHKSLLREKQSSYVQVDLFHTVPFKCVGLQLPEILISLNGWGGGGEIKVVSIHFKITSGD